MRRRHPRHQSLVAQEVKMKHQGCILVLITAAVIMTATVIQSCVFLRSFDRRLDELKAKSALIKGR